jgi:group I intron endonuclease
MTTGIYKLVFIGSTKCYIGQSINIESRFKQHLASFKNRTANHKLLVAYDTYGLPDLEILCVCSINELNILEEEAINIFNSVDNGFNIYTSAKQVPIYYGETHPKSKYTAEQILTAAKLLCEPNNKGSYISEITGVQLSTIQDIARLNSHAWIKDIDPITYNKLISLKGTRKNPKTLEQRDTEYPAVISPSGLVYKSIPNLKQFCITHNLHRSNFRRMLLGKSSVCQGWKLLNG